MSTIRIKPVEGSKLPIFEDARRHINKETEVSDNSYYRRALASKTVSLCESKPEKKRATKAPKVED